MINLTRAICEEKEYAAFIDCAVKECAPGTAKRRPAVVTGLCEGAEFAFVENLYELSQRCGYNGVFLLVSDEKKANRLCRWLEDYGRKAYFYTARDLILYHAGASHDFEHERLFVLEKLLKGACEYLISTPDALVQYTIPRARLKDASTVVRQNGEYDVKEIVGKLENGGYRRMEIVESKGQYALRGGILDVFSPAESEPVRIEFFGDTVDRMCYFDVLTQRRTEDCAVFEPIPAHELNVDEQAKKRILGALKPLMKSAVGQVKEELEEEYENVLSGVETLSLDKYLPLIYPEKESLCEYAAGLMPVALEYGACMNRLDGCEQLEKAQIRTLLEEGRLSGRHADYGKDASDVERMFFEGFSVLISSIGSRLSGHRYAGMFSFRTKQTTGYRDRFDLLLDDLRGYMASSSRVKLICENEASAANMEKMLTDAGFGAYRDDGKIEQRPASVAVTWGQGIPGFELIASRFVLLTEQGERTLIKRGSVAKRKQKHDGNVKRILSYADLNAGDYVVHESHGIGRFIGMTSLTVEGARRDFLKIAYAEGGALYLPCDQLDKISKYIGKGAEDGTIRLSRMGEAEWKRTKYRAKAAVKDMAKQLIALYAERVRRPGISFPSDDAMQREFEESFEYEETECQLQASNEVKRDMEKNCPMDRLLCGDVGYGKTEVALRAVFKAVEGGWQAAILVPTTILCMQHYRTLLSRMRGYPVNVDMVCRFRTKKEIDESLRKLRRGETDVIVGTHRLLSKDVEFKKLGLLIVDEEQRFGVTHKEKLKQLATDVDVLTLSATPIPRTMNMALSGIRDMSILDEAPVDRQPVQTIVMEEDDALIEEAIRRELRRGGQVFYLCSRIDKMDPAAKKLRAAFKDVVIETAHGQMDRDALSDIWNEMVEGKIDILISTTIIETGIDVPNANTLIIEDADRFGLSQLHQLRGRVGRSSRRAYAYFTYPKYKELSEISQKRLAAIRDFTEFGSGFRIAMRDMELRGVGNLLGAEQHGHMETIGYDLYMKLLFEAVLEEKGEKKEEKKECTVETGLDAYIPENYISAQNQRIDVYKKIALIENQEDLSDVLDELIDRYGEPPTPVDNLLRISLLRAAGSASRVQKIVYKGTSMLIYPQTCDAARMARLASEYNGKLLISFGSSPYMALRTGKMKFSAAVSTACGILEKYKEKENS
ncbi:MAG: transcription-repair coupling factor [Clostridia bacterium]|nr:transcription-repair coupling factor [Clostridia bacterium]